MTPKKASDNRHRPGPVLVLIREPRVHYNDKQRRRCERRLNLRSKCRAFAAREQRWQANRPYFFGRLSRRRARLTSVSKLGSGFVAGAGKALHELIDKLAQHFDRLEW
jgi:hypothetical protein